MVVVVDVEVLVVVVGIVEAGVWIEVVVVVGEVVGGAGLVVGLQVGVEVVVVVVEVEHATFTPLVFSATGGMGIEAMHYYKRFATGLALKWDSPYSVTMSWL